MLTKNTKFIFLFGIISSYISLIIVTSIYYFYFIFLWFFITTYICVRDFKKALFITSIFAVPYSHNLFNVSPFTTAVLLLSLLSVKDKLFQRIGSRDIFLLLFFSYGVISYLLVNTSSTVLSGIFKLGIYILFYIFAKEYVADHKIRKMCIFILISIAIFESSLAIIQFLIGHPLGKFIEEGIKNFPYGRMSDEDNTILRANGTFEEPTYLARFLTILLPLILVYVQHKFFGIKILKLLIPLIVLIAIFVSLTRFSWLTALFTLGLFFFWKKRKFNLSNIPKSLLTIVTITFLCIGVILLPYLTYKIQVTPLAFQEFGSFDFRIKLIKESLNLISQYPLFGVGLNRFSEFAGESNITGLYNVFDKANVHNVFLRIASEMGIPALVFFLGFIIITYYSYLKNRKNIGSSKLKMIKDVAAFGGLIYLLEASMGTIFLTPHLALFFLYMAIINT